MRRSTATVIGAVIGAALFAGARLGTPPVGTSSHTTADPGVDPDVMPTGDAAPASAGPTPSPSAGAVPPPSGGPVATTPTGGSTRTTAAPPPAGGTSLRNGTYPGSSITHKYGTLKVTITVAGGKISAITESYTTSLRVSEEINRDALPKLRQQALVAQSARIDTVSGATYTSNAYRTSLQAAIDRARG